MCSIKKVTSSLSEERVKGKKCEVSRNVALQCLYAKCEV